MKRDILERLDDRRRQETDITELELLLLDAADEIERLREAVATRSLVTSNDKVKK